MPRAESHFFPSSITFFSLLFCQNETRLEPYLSPLSTFGATQLSGSLLLPKRDAAYFDETIVKMGIK